MNFQTWLWCIDDIIVLSGARGTASGTCFTGDTASLMMRACSPYTIVVTVELESTGGKAKRLIDDSNGYVNSGNITVKCWLVGASDDIYN